MERTTKQQILILTDEIVKLADLQDMIEEVNEAQFADLHSKDSVKIKFVFDWIKTNISEKNVVELLNNTEKALYDKAIDYTNTDNFFTAINDFNETIYYAHLKLLFELVVFILEDKTNYADVVTSTNYLALHQTNGFLDALYAQSKLKVEGELDIFETAKELTKSNTKVKIQEDEQFSLAQLEKMISPQQLLVLIYAMSKHERGEGRATIDIKEYCDLRGINRETRNVKKLLDDLKVLERTLFEFQQTRKRNGASIKETVLYSRVLSVMDVYTRQNRINVAFGDWIHKLPKDQYMLIDKGIFKLRTNQAQEQAIVMSLRLYSRIRNELYNKKTKKINNLKTVKLSVAKLLDEDYYSENTIKAKGFTKAIKQPFEAALDHIAETQNFSWHYAHLEGKDMTHANFNEFKEDYIVFSNKKLIQEYLVTSNRNK